MIPADLQYAHPEVFYLLIVLLPLLLLWYRLKSHQGKVSQSYSKEPVLLKLLHPRSKLFSRLSIAALLLCWSFTIVSLAGPYGNIRYRHTAEEERVVNVKEKWQLHILVDVSASMAVADAYQQPRLDVAKEIAAQVMRQAKASQMALYAFTSNLIPLVPLTMDRIFTKALLQDLQINEGGSSGTDLTAALSSLHEREAEQPKHSSAILLLTDGGDTNIEELSGAQRQGAIDRLSAIFPQAGDCSHLFVVGVGSKEGGVVPNVTSNKGAPVLSKLDDEILGSLDKGYMTTGDFSINQIAQRIVDRIQSLSENGEGTAEAKVSAGEALRDLYFQIPLAAAILMLMGMMLLPESRRRS